MNIEIPEVSKVIELNRQAIMLIAIEKYDEAIVYLEKAKKLDSMDKDTYSNLGNVYASKKEYYTAEDYFKINDELKKYSEKLAGVIQVVALTKTDLLDKETLNEKVAEFKKKTKTNPVLLCSIIHQGLEELKHEIWNALEKAPKPQSLEVEMFDFDSKDTTSLDIIRHDDGSFEVVGGFIDNLIRGVVLSDELSNAYFQNALKKFKIIEALKNRGLKDGDTVIIKDIVFEYDE